MVHVHVQVLIGPRARTVIGRSVVPPGAGSAVDDPHPAPGPDDTGNTGTTGPAGRQPGRDGPGRLHSAPGAFEDSHAQISHRP